MPSLGLNAAFGLLTNMLGVRADPYHGFNFLVEIEGILAGGFSECSGLQIETEVMEYREGGVNEHMHTFVTGTKYPPLVLKHGLTMIDGLWQWHQEIVEGKTKVKRRNGTIYLLSKQHIPVLWWDFVDALPVKWVGPDLRADSSQVAIESLELRHRGLKRPAAAALAGLADLGVSIAGGIPGSPF